MRKAVYNSAIPESILKSVNPGCRVSSFLFAARLIFILVMSASAVSALAADWSIPERQLAQKIVAVIGPGAAALTVENQSSLGRRNCEIVQNGLRSALEQLGVRLVKPEQAAATITLSLSENASSYVWVAQIRQGEADAAVVMVSMPRTGGATTVRDSTPMTLRKTLLWSQDTPILDVAILEENATPTRIATLDANKVTIYRMQGGKWQEEQSLPIAHLKPLPRDVRGRLMPAKDHLLDVNLPGVSCHSNAAVPLKLSCRETDDPWPLVPPGLVGNASVFPGAGAESRSVIPSVTGFFAPTRNFFTGAITPALGKFTNVSKFYSSAMLPREKYTLWFFATTDGQIHMVDGMNDQTARVDWGPSIASLKTNCGAGWQILATSRGVRSSDSVRAYEFPDRDAVAVSAELDFPGSITEMWTEARGDTAIAIAKNAETGDYEAYRLAMACGQ